MSQNPKTKALRNQWSTPEQLKWLANAFANLTTELEVITPSRCAETTRYLPQSTTPMAGYYSFRITPYLREIVDCFDVNSPIREVSWMKGAQIGATTALENIILYTMVHVKTAPVMLLTADAELAKNRLEGFIVPMIQASGLGGLLKSTDVNNARKTGLTDKKVSWIGGGSLLPFGAVNANKLRSVPIRFLLRDETDGYPLSVGKEGCPLAISAKRTNAYKSSYKIFDISTPTIKGISKIEDRFKQGDQRYYFVRCLKCGHPQTLRWERKHTDGSRTGIVWEMQDGRLVPGSVRYLCSECKHPHTNDDKIRLLAPECGAEWRPTAIPQAPHMRSYHLSGLYSPVGMNTWEACVLEWLEAWDVERNQCREVLKLQAFYNTVLGDPWEFTGAKIGFEQISAHRREVYHYGEIPNKWAVQACGSPVLILVCTVDVHDDNLSVAVWGWCRDKRVLLIDYHKFEGSTDRIDEPSTWGQLMELIDKREYMADDGKRYYPTLTLVDSGYKASVVYDFCRQYQSGVVSIKGQKHRVSGGFEEFKKRTLDDGGLGYHITVDHYKDRWASAISKHWSGMGEQPATFFNAPVDATDRQLRQLTAESKEPVEKDGKVQIEWKRHGDNTLWDLLIYAHAAHDVIAQEWLEPLPDSFTVFDFWDTCERDALFWTPD